MSTAETGSPNQYHLQGCGISVSYFPEGFSPGPTPIEGDIHLTYQDAHQSLVFRDKDVRVVEVDDLGSVVSVSLTRSIDVGYTSFSLIVPEVRLPDGVHSTPVQTEGITTVHRALALALGHPQRETYSVPALAGTAANTPLPK
jgi:hypothetical protein